MHWNSLRHTQGILEIGNKVKRNSKRTKQKMFTTHPSTPHKDGELNFELNLANYKTS